MPRKTTTPASRGVKPPTKAKPHVRTGPKTAPRSARRPARGGTKRDDEETAGRGAAKKSTAKRPAEPAKKAPRKPVRQVGTPPDVEAQLLAIEQGAGDGEVELGHDTRLHVSSLGRVIFPETGATKGAVMRYYTRMSRFILPDIDGRPLILKRYPTGVGGEMFFQQDAGPHVPDTVRVDQVETVDKGRQDRIIGGDLATLLYTVQLGAIEIHPWFSRVQDIDSPDRCLIDLDPGEGVPFAWVVELAQEIVRIARKVELPVVLKTSGSRGIHLVFPLPARTTYDTSLALAELVARAATVARPDLATVERSIRSRPERSIYVDAMQNSHGKSMAAAYSLRAKPAATVSAPLRPRELTPRLKLTGFTITTIPARSERIGDIWREGLSERPTVRALGRAMKALEATLE
ncbi:MAG: dependent ligase [Gemmatimonadetes bacterium]|jgi:bifunctional non-homologous end joining protein LigD|nr:dependent ligase [Gemmatimonadota bacterium]